nr:actin - mouse (fragments) [Mus musculus]
AVFPSIVGRPRVAPEEHPVSYELP